MQTRAAEVIVLEAGRLYMESCQRWRTGTLYFARNDFLQSGLATQAGRMASECVEKLFYAGGTTGAKRGQRLNRYYRDMATYRTHPIAQYQTAAEAMGQAHFDLPMPMLEAVGGARSSKRT